MVPTWTSRRSAACSSRARPGADIKIPKAVDAAFAGVDEEITAAIAAYRSQRIRKLETDLFEQRTRLAAAEKTLTEKITKKASEDVRIATNKMDAATRGLDDLRRQDLQGRDSRIFPGWYAPVLIELDGKRLVVPMRYSKVAFAKLYDRKTPLSHLSKVSMSHMEGGTSALKNRPRLPTLFILVIVRLVIHSAVS
nr:hypothetical protein [Burkholderia vietnamiensis]